MKSTVSEWMPEEPDFELFGIYSHLKDYRLCWLLNEAMAFDLVRVDDFLEDRDDPLVPCYSQFGWTDAINHHEIYLLSNQPLIKNARQDSGMLFETERVELLIPDKPKVDYFIKLCGQFETRELDLIEADLSAIGGIGLVERIDPMSLRSFINLMH